MVRDAVMLLDSVGCRYVLGKRHLSNTEAGGCTLLDSSLEERGCGQERMLLVAMLEMYTLASAPCLISLEALESASSATSGGAFGVDFGAAVVFLGMLGPATLALVVEV